MGVIDIKQGDLTNRFIVRWPCALDGDTRRGEGVGVTGAGAVAGAGAERK